MLHNTNFIKGFILQANTTERWRGAVLSKETERGTPTALPKQKALSSRDSLHCNQEV